MGRQFDLLWYDRLTLYLTRLSPDGSRLAPDLFIHNVFDFSYTQISDLVAVSTTEIAVLVQMGTGMPIPSRARWYLMTFAVCNASPRD
jgi:hypothetical protein